ncbi:MAG: class I SAM-dependent methyltransferase [Acholeplasmataceae bacterium]
MGHYFRNDPELASDRRVHDFRVGDTVLRFLTDHGVFSKTTLDPGSRFLLERITIADGVDTVIDMGCGYGPIGLFVAYWNPEVDVHLYDINERALALAKANIDLNAIKNASVHASDLFRDVAVRAQVILTNPPIRAGKRVLFELYQSAHDNLLYGGTFYCVIRKQQGAPSSLEEIRRRFGNGEVIGRHKGYWLISARKST